MACTLLFRPLKAQHPTAAWVNSEDYSSIIQQFLVKKGLIVQSLLLLIAVVNELI